MPWGTGGDKLADRPSRRPIGRTLWKPGRRPIQRGFPFEQGYGDNEDTLDPGGDDLELTETLLTHLFDTGQPRPATADNGPM